MSLFYSAVRVLASPPVGLYFGLGTRGRLRVPRRGGLLIASNHVSYLDPLVLGCCAPRPLHFLARATLFRNPLFGALIGNLHSIPVRRGGADRRAMASALEVLKRGQAMVLFPEGTRSASGRLMRGHPGVGHLALQADVPVITAYVEGAHRAMPRGSVIPRPHRITVHWGEVRSPEEWLSLAEDEGEKQRPSDALVSVLMKDIARLGGQTSDSLAG